MSLEIKSITEQETGTGYDQITAENVSGSSASSKSSFELREGRSDRNLLSSSTSSRTNGAKASIAFNLSFVIKLANRTPFDPNHRC